MIKVTLILPVYNTSKFLKRCLDSVINQSFKNLEIICVNDGSTDDSLEILNEYEKIDNRIRIYSKINEGLGKARNYGIERATGDFIGFIDSDDFIDVNAINVLVQAIEKNNVDAVSQKNFFYYSDKKIIKPNFLVKNKLYKDKEIYNDFLPLIIGPDLSGGEFLGMSVWRTLYKKKIIDEHKIRFFSEREIVSEDLLFNLNFYSHCESTFICDYTGYYYCYNGASLTHSTYNDKHKKYDSLLEKALEIMKEKNMPSSCLKRLDCSYIFALKNLCTVCTKNDHNYKTKIFNIKRILEARHIKEVCIRLLNYDIPFKAKILVKCFMNKNSRLLYLLIKVHSLKKE